jgi:hypothetical protein
MRLSGAKRGLWQDFEQGEGGDVLDLIARVRGVGLGEAIRIAKTDYLGDEIRLAARQPAATAPRTAAAEPNVEDRIKTALRIWRESVPLPGTLGEHYLVKHRRLDVTRLDLVHALRWHAGINAVVALMTDPGTDEPIGVHRTFLDAFGAKIKRKMLGRTGVVRLSADDSVTMGLGLTEGVEDGLAVLLSGWAPIWAATSAGAIARFPVLPGVEALTIFADVDAPGMQSAEHCSGRWRAAGREVVIAAPGRCA